MGGEPNVGTATVMFTDLVGSTEIRSRVGEDAAETLRSVHDEVLGEAIATNGGQVVKHLGDGLMATFPERGRRRRRSRGDAAGTRPSQSTQ